MDTLVLKLGGAAGVDHQAALDDVARLHAGEAHRPSRPRLVVVHGGSAEADRLGVALGRAPRTLRSPSGHESRYTDPETLEVFVQATALVNRRLVGALHARGVRAVGVSGMDGALLLGRRKSAIRTVVDGRVHVVRDDWSGRIEAVRPDLLHALLDSGHVPVIAPLAMTAAGEPLNVDGDRVAAAVASALGARELVLLTGADGVYRAFPDPSSRVDTATSLDLDDLLAYAQGRMKRKIVAAREALEGGVSRVRIAAARGPWPVTYALEGRGTTISPGSDLPLTTGGER